MGPVANPNTYSDVARGIVVGATPNSAAVTLAAALKIELENVAAKVIAPRMLAQNHFLHAGMFIGFKGSSGPFRTTRSGFLKSSVSRGRASPFWSSISVDDEDAVSGLS